MSSTTSHTIYLAGPTVFEKNAAEIFDHLKALCAKYGLVGESPLDTLFESQDFASKREMGVAIYHANVEKVKACSAILADVSPFRGATEPDSGTCFEIGMGVALGKPVACYSLELAHNFENRVIQKHGVQGKGLDRVDAEFGMQIESFDLPLNLMIGVSCTCFTREEQAIAWIAQELARKQA